MHIGMSTESMYHLINLHGYPVAAPRSGNRMTSASQKPHSHPILPVNTLPPCPPAPPPPLKVTTVLTCASGIYTDMLARVFGCTHVAVLQDLHLALKFLGHQVRTCSAPAHSAEVVPTDTPTGSTERSTCSMSLPTCDIVS